MTDTSGPEPANTSAPAADGINPPTDPTRAAGGFAANRVDGGEMQRQKRGISSSTSDRGAVVVPFPSATDRTRVRRDEESSAWRTGADDSPSSARRSTGTTSPPDARRPKRARRGPNPIGVLMPSIALPADLSGSRPTDVGVLTHAVVAILAPHLRDMSPWTLPERVLDVTGSLINFQRTTKARPLMLTAAGHASFYLRRLAPAPPWELLGSEYRVSDEDDNRGRVDLAWQHSETGQVMFDELKTTSRAIETINNVWRGQVNRYADAGKKTHGDLFVGVRLLPLGALYMSSLITARQHTIRLDPTPEQPLRMRHDARSEAACCDTCALPCVEHGDASGLIDRRGQ